MNTPNPAWTSIPNRRPPPVAPAGGARARQSGQSSVRSRQAKRERAYLRLTKSRSAALSARSDGFDDIDGSPERGVYTQMRGIEQVRVGRAFERGGAAPRIAFVAPQQVGQDRLLIRRFAARLQFAR